MTWINPSFGQIKEARVNKVWEQKSSTPSELLEFTNSYVDPSGYLYLTGNDVQPDGSIVLLLQKFGVNGDVIWKEGWSCGACIGAFGIDVVADNAGFVYVVGAISQLSSVLTFDIVVQKYQASNGALVWTNTLDFNGSAQELPVDLLVNTSGVFVAGTTQQGGQYDAFLAKLQLTDGAVAWDKLYDYNGHDETAVELSWENGNVKLLAGSSSDPVNWAASLLTYSSGGSLQNTWRSASTQLSLDEPIAYRLDNNHLYVGGSRHNAANGTTDGYLQHYLLGSSNTNASWEHIVDVSGRAETVLGIKVCSGDVIVTGGTRDAQAVNWSWLQRLDPNGNTQWEQIRKAAPAEDIISGRYFTVDNAGNIIVAVDRDATNEKSIHLCQYSTEGKLKWEVPLARSESKARATNVLLHEQKEVLASGIFQGTDGKNYYQVNKLEKRDRTITYATDAQGRPAYINEDLIIRFDPSVVNTEFVNKQSADFAYVSDVITDPNVISSLDAALGAGGTLADWRFHKIFGCTRSDKVEMIGRHGKKVAMPPLWATFVLELAPGMTTKPPQLMQAVSSASIPGVVYSLPNYAAEFPAAAPPPPNDPLFGEQESFLNFNTGTNVEAAWDILDAANSWSNRSVNVALIDSGVRFQHEDFRCAGCTGIDPQDGGGPTLVQEAIQFRPSFAPLNMATVAADDQDGDVLSGALGHGTRAAGILAAVRGNGSGVAGVASGTNGADGIGLYSYRFAESQDISNLAAILKALMYTLDCSDCAVEGIDCVTPSPIDLVCIEAQFNTEQLPPAEYQPLEELTYLMYQAGLILTTARGNFGHVTTIGQYGDVYPAVFADDWLITVGASGTNGELVIASQNDGGDAYGANAGQGMDLIAPGVNPLIRTTSAESNTAYARFNGSSAALPHATGAGALLLFHHPTELAQEDVEHLLEYSASSIQGASYTDDNGWGRLNVGRAVELIDPAHDNLRVVHVDVEANALQREIINVCAAPGQLEDVTIRTIEGTACEDDFSLYQGNLIRYTYDFSIDLANYGLAPAPTFSDPTKQRWWVRNSASNLLGAPSCDGDEVTFAPWNATAFVGTPTLQGTVLSGSLVGYSVDVTSSCFGGSLVCGDTELFPSATTPVELLNCQRGAPRFTFSILAVDPSGLNEDIIITSTEGPDNTNAGLRFQLVPNPTTGLTQLSLDDVANHTATTGIDQLTAQLLDGRGQILYQGILRLGAGTTQWELPTQHLPAGLYFVRLLSTTEQSTLKLLKQ